MVALIPGLTVNSPSKNIHGGWWACWPLLVAAIGLPSAGAADPRASTTKGFVVARFVTALYEGKTGRTAAWDKSDGLPECPEGLALPPETDAVLAELPAAERQRLKRPENAQDLMIRILQRGPHNTDVCRHPESMPDPGFRIVKGKFAYGLDLDGSDGTTTPVYNCPHENFVGPNGERGIDNQMYRAVGCIKGRRQGSEMYEYFNTNMRQGDYTILIELTGVDDLKNDNEVQVGFYAGQDAMMNSIDGRVALTNTSLRVHHDRHYHAVTRGKIVAGVLTTEPVDVLFKAGPEMAPYRFRDARFRGEIQPDGSLKGTLGGYEDIATIYSNLSADRELVENDHEGPMTCPGLYYALQRLADAYPDTPGGGRCKWMSSAYEVEAVPAFVIHPKDDQQSITKAEQAK